MQPPPNVPWWPIKTLSTLLGAEPPLQKINFLGPALKEFFPNPPHPLPGGTVHQTFDDICTSVVYVGGGSRLTPPALPRLMGGGSTWIPPSLPS